MRQVERLYSIICYWEKKQSIKTSYIFQDIIENTTKTHYTKSPNVPCNEIIACFFFFLNLHDCEQKGFLSLVFVLEFFDFVRQEKFSLFMYVLKGIFWYISRHFPAVFFGKFPQIYFLRSKKSLVRSKK